VTDTPSLFGTGPDTDRRLRTRPGAISRTTSRMGQLYRLAFLMSRPVPPPGDDLRPVEGFIRCTAHTALVALKPTARYHAVARPSDVSLDSLPPAR
jgi:hypothetical protein